MTWYCLVLTEGQAAAEELELRTHDFSEAFKAAGAPRMMALFQKQLPGGGVELCFTPECGVHAAALIEKWNCTPCDPPPMAGLQLLVGFNEITYYLY